MIVWLAAAVAATVLLLGLCLGLFLRGLVVTREDRRRLNIVASQLVTMARIDQATLATLAAMRETVRHQQPSDWPG